PLLVDEQIRGGVVQGLGAAFFEECVYNEEGQLTNGSLADYLVPMSFEMPDIETAHIETPTRDTELGAKGCGEAGTAAASAAAMNAVNDALAGHGVSLTQIPMTPARILKALGTIWGNGLQPGRNEHDTEQGHTEIRDHPPHRADRHRRRRRGAVDALGGAGAGRHHPHRLSDAADRAVRGRGE